MKISNLLFASLFCTVTPLFAAISLEPFLNKVTLQLKAEQWITTQTALVNVNINAAVSDQNIANLQNDVLQKLKQLADTGDWHIITFDRQQDQSGLESIQIAAQARLPQTNLANLRDKAKAMSKPGETYTIDSVQFVPSESEIRQANTNLRNNIYQQIKMEIDTINKMYPDQKFYVHNINFIFNQPAPMAMAQMAMPMKAVGEAGAANLASPTPLAVGNKAELNARIEIAAMPEQLAQKLVASNSDSKRVTYSLRGRTEASLLPETPAARLLLKQNPNSK